MGFLGDNRFRFGLFGINCANGMTPSRAPERWRAEWPQIVEVAKLADDAGVEFLLPIAKWHGLGGEANMWGRSFETFTQAAALAALTQRTGIFVTAHVSLVTPAFAAKAIATIDHVSNGRAGLNIVCGWNPDEFNQHGVKLDGERRYDRGLEWYRIYDRLLEGGPAFDWVGEFFDMQGLSTDPLPVQKRPPVMSAAQSGDGQVFAAQAADILFTSMHSDAQVVETVGRFSQMAQGHGRKPLVCVETQLVCRPTRKEALDFAHYYAVEMADTDALAYFARQKAKTASASTRQGTTGADVTISRSIEAGAGRKYPGMFPGMHPVIGTPDDLVAEFARLSAMGVDGSTLVFLNYANELPFFLDEVLPRMERCGLRNPLSPKVL